MATATVPHSPNGVKPLVGARACAKVVPILAPLQAKVDHLGELRGLLKQAEVVERELTREVLTALEAAGLERFAGQQAMAVVDKRTTLRPDPELFVEALGARAFEAITVGVTAASRLLPAEDLEAISEATTTPVLRVERLARGTAA